MGKIWASRSKRSRLLGTSALLAAGSLAALALGEAYFRWVSPVPPNEHRWYHPYLVTGEFKGSPDSLESPEFAGYRKNGLIYHYQPEIAVSTVESRGDYFFGDRLDRSLPDPRGRRKRVMILGASMALGAGSTTPSGKWTVLLENGLRAKLRSDEIDVFTVATNSFVSTQERIALELYVLPKKPDAIVVLDGFNDMGALFHHSRPGDPYNMGALYARNDSFRFQLLLALSDRSALVRHFLVKGVRNAAREALYHIERNPKLSDNYARGIASVYNDNIKRMSKRCEQERIPCFFLFQPDRVLTEYYRGNDQEFPLYSRISLQMLETLRKEGRFSRGSQFRDLSHLLDQHPELYVDRVHFSDEGHKLLAESVAEMLLASRVLR